MILLYEHQKRTEVKSLNLCSTSNMANDIGTILVGHEAVEIGLIDEIGGLDKALAKLRSAIELASKPYAGANKSN